MEEKENVEIFTEDNNDGLSKFPFQISMRKTNSDNDEDDNFDDFFEVWQNEQKQEKESQNYKNNGITFVSNINDKTLTEKKNSHNKCNKNNIFKKGISNNNKFIKDDKESINEFNKRNVNKVQTKEKVDFLASQFYAKPVYTKETQCHYDIKTNQNELESLNKMNFSNNYKNNAQIIDSSLKLSNQSISNTKIKQAPIQSNQKKKLEEKLGIKDEMRYNSISKENNSIINYMNNIPNNQQMETNYFCENKLQSHSSSSFNNFDEVSDKEESNPITFQSEILLKIIFMLQIGDTFPFWYVRIGETTNSEGPKSTKNIIDEYTKNHLNDENQICPLDIFQPIHNNDKFMFLKDINYISKEDEFFNKYKINSILIDLKEKYDNIKKEMYEKKFFSQVEEPKINKKNPSNKRRRKKCNSKKQKCSLEEQQIKTGFKVEFKA